MRELVFHNRMAHISSIFSILIICAIQLPNNTEPDIANEQAMQNINRIEPGGDFVSVSISSQ